MTGKPIERPLGVKLAGTPDVESFEKKWQGSSWCGDHSDLVALLHRMDACMDSTREPYRENRVQLARQDVELLRKPLRAGDYVDETDRRFLEDAEENLEIMERLAVVDLLPEAIGSREQEQLSVIGNPDDLAQWSISGSFERLELRIPNERKVTGGLISVVLDPLEGPSLHVWSQEKFWGAQSFESVRSVLLDQRNKWDIFRSNGTLRLLFGTFFAALALQLTTVLYVTAAEFDTWGYASIVLSLIGLVAIPLTVRSVNFTKRLLPATQILSEGERPRLPGWPLVALAGILLLGLAAIMNSLLFWFS